MRKFFALLSLICVGVLSANAASAPKATGDASSVNIYSGNQFNVTFNAIATKAGTGSLPAKGSLIYEDSTVTYTMDVQFVQVVDNQAWFVGQVTSTTDNTNGVAVGDWIFYKVLDKGEPGIGQDQIWGENVTKSGRANDSDSARSLVTNKILPNIGQTDGMIISDGNIQVH